MNGADARGPGPAGAQPQDLLQDPGAITVVLAEDQHLVLDALTQLLNLESGIRVVGTALDGFVCVDLAARFQPDVCLLDVEMPGLDGLQAIPEVLRLSPTTHCAILTTFARPGYLTRALSAGASGFLVKDQPVAALARAIREIAQGKRVIDAALAAQTLVSGSSPLTDRERDALAAAREGLAADEMARRLYVTEGTVRNYLSQAMHKLGATNRAQAIRMAEQQGWL